MEHHRREQILSPPDKPSAQQTENKDANECARGGLQIVAVHKQVIDHEAESSNYIQSPVGEQMQFEPSVSGEKSQGTKQRTAKEKLLDKGREITHCKETHFRGNACELGRDADRRSFADYVQDNETYSEQNADENILFPVGSAPKFQPDESHAFREPDKPGQLVNQIRHDKQDAHRQPEALNICVVAIIEHEKACDKKTERRDYDRVPQFRPEL